MRSDYHEIISSGLSLPCRGTTDPHRSQCMLGLWMFLKHGTPRLSEGKGLKLRAPPYCPLPPHSPCTQINRQHSINCLDWNELECTGGQQLQLPPPVSTRRGVSECAWRGGEKVRVRVHCLASLLYKRLVGLTSFMFPPVSSQQKHSLPLTLFASASLSFPCSRGRYV